MGWLGLKLEYRNVLELLENCKIRVFTAQRSLGRISEELSATLTSTLVLCHRH